MSATCLTCNGEGEVDTAPLDVQYGGPYVLADYAEECRHCLGTGECECRDCVDTAAENAFSAMCESEPPISMAERHRMAWQEKRESRR